MSLRSPLSIVLNHGSARDGVDHWWIERITSVALVPLTLWLLVALLRLPLGDHAAVLAWIGAGIHPVLLGLLVLVACRHSQLGIQVVIEDYVHGHGSKLFMLLLSAFVHVLLAAGGVYAVLRIALRSVG